MLNARIFDTTVLTWDISQACDIDHHIDEEQAGYVLYVAERLVPAVRTQSPERYKKEVTGGAGTTTVDKLIGVTGRNPNWKINQKRD